MEKYKAYIEETDLHYKLMDFINPETQYGLDKQIKNTDGADSRDFKRGAMWGAAMFLLFASVECDKIHCRVLNDEEIKIRKQFENNYESYLLLRKEIISLIDAEKRAALNKVEQTQKERELGFEYHKAICELGDKIMQLMDKEKL